MMKLSKYRFLLGWYISTLQVMNYCICDVDAVHGINA